MSLSVTDKGVILGIESSCDETSAALLVDGELRSVVISSQFFHHQFGGVVPELASRAHVRSILPIVRETFRRAELMPQSISAIAATYAPGLMGSLLVGLNFAKGYSLCLDVPLIGVHHIEAHIFSALLETERPDLPFLALVVSGGHTLLIRVNDVGDYTFVGETRDDAAGEAFDKVGKMLGLSYPAGPKIDVLARTGNPDFIRFPRAMLSDPHFDFSFSGIKTSVLYWLNNHTDRSPEITADVAASFQRAMVEVLVGKTLRAAKQFQIRDIVCVGGVSANSELRETFRTQCALHGKRFYTPRPLYSTDNAAMIAMLGALKFDRKQFAELSLAALPRIPLAQRISH